MLKYKHFNPKGVTKGQVFTFTFIETKKYNKYEVATRKSKKLFGTVKWFFPWQEYGFFPEQDINVMSKDMLFDIYSFINYLEYDLEEEERARWHEKEDELREGRVKSPEEIALLIKNDKEGLLKEGKRLLEFNVNIQYKIEYNCYLILALSEQYRLESGCYPFLKGKSTTGFKGWLISKRLDYLEKWMEENIIN